LRCRLSRLGPVQKSPCRFDRSQCASPGQQASATPEPFRLEKTSAQNRGSRVLLEGIASHIAGNLSVYPCPAYSRVRTQINGIRASLVPSNEPLSNPKGAAPLSNMPICRNCQHGGMDHNWVSPPCWNCALPFLFRKISAASEAWAVSVSRMQIREVCAAERSASAGQQVCRSAVAPQREMNAENAGHIECIKCDARVCTRSNWCGDIPTMLDAAQFAKIPFLNHSELPGRTLYLYPILR
jgi:hypothetical protein